MSIQTDAQARFDVSFARPPLVDRNRISRRGRNNLNGFIRVNAAVLARDADRLSRRTASIMRNYIGDEAGRLSASMRRLGEWDKLADHASALYRSMKDPRESSAKVRRDVRAFMRETNVIQRFVEGSVRRALRVTPGYMEGLERLLTTSRVLYAESGASFVHRQLAAVDSDDLVDRFGIRKAHGPVNFTPVDDALVDILFGGNEELLLEALHDRSNQIVFVQMTDAQFADLQDAIRDTLYANGAGAQEVSRELANRFGDSLLGGLLPKQMKQRVELWARTEGAIIQNDALIKAGINAGMDGQVWSTVGDSRVRPDHASNEGDGVIPMDAVFSDGSTDGGSGSVSPFMCRCVVGPAMLPAK